MFPQELLHIIFDHLKTDIPLLKQCALVSPLFLALSQQRLFRRLVLKKRNQHQIAFLASSRVLSYVHDLELCDEQIYTIDLWSDRGWAADEESLPGLLSAISPQLKRLALRGIAINWRKISSGLREALSLLIRQAPLSELVLDGTKNFPSSLFRHCKSLRSLTLSGSLLLSHWELRNAGTDSPWNTPEEESVQLEYLNINVSADVFPIAVEWILDPRCPINITSVVEFVCMHRILWDDTFAYLLQRMSSSLQSLELGSHPREDILPIYPDYTKLPPLPHLQEILLGPFPVLHFPPNTMDHDPLPWVIKFLDGILTDTSLKRAHLRLYTFGGAITIFPFYNLGWKLLDKHLRLLTQLDHLQVELSCFHRPSSKFVTTFRAFLEHQFPSFADAGHLHVISGRDSWFRG